MSVRSRFVADVLEEEGATMLRYQESAIRKSTKSHTGRLIGRRRITVEAGSDASGKLTLHHLDYERFLDMKRLKGSKKPGRRRRIHNRYVFGTYSSIAKRLMQELSDGVASAACK